MSIQNAVPKEVRVVSGTLPAGMTVNIAVAPNPTAEKTGELLIEGSLSQALTETLTLVLEVEAENGTTSRFNLTLEPGTPSTFSLNIESMSPIMDQDVYVDIWLSNYEGGDPTTLAMQSGLLVPGLEPRIIRDTESTGKLHLQGIPHVAGTTDGRLVVNSTGGSDGITLNCTVNARPVTLTRLNDLAVFTDGHQGSTPILKVQNAAGLYAAADESLPLNLELVVVGDEIMVNYTNGNLDVDENQFIHLSQFTVNYNLPGGETAAKTFSLCYTVEADPPMGTWYEPEPNVLSPEDYPSVQRMFFYDSSLQTVDGYSVAYKDFPGNVTWGTDNPDQLDVEVDTPTTPGVYAYGLSVVMSQEGIGTTTNLLQTAAIVVENYDAGLNTKIKANAIIGLNRAQKALIGNLGFDGGVVEHFAWVGGVAPGTNTMFEVVDGQLLLSTDGVSAFTVGKAYVFVRNQSGESATAEIDFRASTNQVIMPILVDPDTVVFAGKNSAARVLIVGLDSIYPDVAIPVDEYGLRLDGDQTINGMTLSIQPSYSGGQAEVWLMGVPRTAGTFTKRFGIGLDRFGVSSFYYFDVTMTAY